MKRLKFWFHRWRNDGLPSPDEVRHYVVMNPDAYRKLGTKIRPSVSLYWQGVSIGDIAREHNVTRERTRQVILKGYRRLKSS